MFFFCERKVGAGPELMFSVALLLVDLVGQAVAGTPGLCQL